MKVAVLASGRGTNLQALINSIEAGEINGQIAAVVSDREDAYALKRAEKHGIKTYYFSPAEFSDRESYDSALAVFLKKLSIDLICLAGFMRILTSELIAEFPNRIINIHPSLLPAFPGLNAQKQALDYGVKYSGCTVHFVDEGVDTGPIIGQRVVPVYEEDTVDNLSDRILEKEHELYPRAVKLISEGKVEILDRKVKTFEEGC